MHQVGDPLIWEHSASWCRGWGRWRLKLGVAWVGVVGRRTGADSPSPSHGLAYFPCTGPWKLRSGFWLQESVRSRPLLRSSPRLLCDGARRFQVCCGVRDQILLGWADGWQGV